MKKESGSVLNGLLRGLKSGFVSVKKVGSGNKENIHTGSLPYGRSSKLIFKFKKTGPYGWMVMQG